MPYPRYGGGSGGGGSNRSGGGRDDYNRGGDQRGGYGGGGGGNVSYIKSMPHHQKGHLQIWSDIFAKQMVK